MKKSDFLYDAFLICTVREADKKDLRFINKYLKSLRNEGKKVYYPATDTEQVDSSGGYQICSDNCKAIWNSKEAHVYWTEKSQGTKFDLGIAFYEHRNFGKNIRLANRSQVEKIVKGQRKEGKGKSFEMVLLKLDDLANE
ncbi:hypothetical protein M0R19_02205 [Candidatus Pacearchaeota archaeon]|nr:hypothetical protein [Candidatus Pacearchaeota archaeon]